MQQTLCWDCANACGGCSWTEHWTHRPVPGWKATPTSLRINNGEYSSSYIVEECPLFERDAAYGGAYRIDKNRDKKANI